MRLDKFLKVSRIIKRRTVANEACDAGRVLINDKPAKASANVRVGDILTIRNDDYFDKNKPGEEEKPSVPEEGDKEDGSTLEDAARVLKTAAEAAVGAATLGLL